MSTYLIVMDRSVPAQSLRHGLLTFVSQHGPAELVLLQLPRPLPEEAFDEARRAAVDHANSVGSLFSAMGLPVVDVFVGDPLPRKAIAAEMNARGRTYEGILLTGRPDGSGLAHQLERKFGVPVAYIEADAPEPAATR